MFCKFMLVASLALVMVTFAIASPRHKRTKFIQLKDETAVFFINWTIFA